MRRFGFEMKRLTITLTHGLKDQGLIDLQAAVAPGRPSRRDDLQRRRLELYAAVKCSLQDIRSNTVRHGDSRARHVAARRVSETAEIAASECAVTFAGVQVAYDVRCAQR